MERKNIITFKGNPLTLLGPELKVGDQAPDFTAMDAGLQAVKLSNFKGQTIIISAVPSLDTPVCQTQTKRFNEVSALNTKIITISMDLPFAQKRFCDASNVKNVVVWSDFKERDFGNQYGVLIKELGLLARSVWVIDPNGKISHIEIVKEVTQEPNYPAAIAKVKSAAHEVERRG